MDYQKLTNIGLSEKEAKVYIASLHLGKATAHKISRKAELLRATTYLILDSLMKKGLISSNTEDNKQFYFPESPEKLEMLFREQEISIQKKREYLKSILPEIKAQQVGVKDAPVVRYYEGTTGTLAMAEELYSDEEKGEMRMMYSYDLLMKMYSEDYRRDMQTKRQKKDIKVKSIINDDKNELETDAKKIKLESKKFPITSEISIFKDKVRISTLKGKAAGIIIENKEISHTLQLLFDIAYDNLLKKNKKGK